MPNTPSYGQIPQQTLSGFNDCVNNYGLTGTLIKANADASGGISGLATTIRNLASSNFVGAAQFLNQVANSITKGGNVGVYTDSDVNGLTTANTAVAGFRAFFTAFNPDIPATFDTGSVLGT